jgi:arsenite-transporting ATPase
VRTILYTGKGGVGKTTLAAATALRSAALGHRTLVISTDIAHSLADALDLPLSNTARPVGAPNLDAAELDTGEELERAWGDIKRRIASILRDEGVSATAAGELAVLPGLDEVLALVRIKRYYDEGRYDGLIIDSAPTGAAMRLLSAPDLTRTYTRHLLGLSRGLARTLLPIIQARVKLPLSEELIQERLGQLFKQVEELRGILNDRTQTSVRLVLNPDHMSLQETQRAYTYLSLFGFAVDAVFVNRVLPTDVQDPFFQHWKTSQAEHLARAKELFAPLPVFEVPLRTHEVVGLTELNALAQTLYGDRDPLPALSTEQPLEFSIQDGRYVLTLRMVGVTATDVALDKRGDELFVQLGHYRRSLALPQYLAGLQPTWARVEGEQLVIVFEDVKKT